MQKEPLLLTTTYRQTKKMRLVELRNKIIQYVEQGNAQIAMRSLNQALFEDPERSYTQPQIKRMLRSVWLAIEQHYGAHFKLDIVQVLSEILKAKEVEFSVRQRNASRYHKRSRSLRGLPKELEVMEIIELQDAFSFILGLGRSAAYIDVLTAHGTTVCKDDIEHLVPYLR